MALVPRNTGGTSCYTRHIFSWPGRGLRFEVRPGPSRSPPAAGSGRGAPFLAVAREAMSDVHKDLALLLSEADQVCDEEDADDPKSAHLSLPSS